MCAIVTCLFEGSTPCSWGLLLGEGSTSLKTLILLLSQRNHHLNCINPMVVLLSGLSYSSLDGTFSFSGWSIIPNCMILFGVNYTSKIGKVVVSAIYSDPGSGSLMSCSLWRICSVTSVMCHGGTCSYVLGVLNGIVLSCFYGNCASCDLEQPLCKSWWLELWCLLYLDCDWDWSLLSQSSWWCLELNLCALWCGASVPEGGILWGQSMTICPYSSHSWHLMWRKCHTMCPSSWHWKHWSSSLDTILTVEDRMFVMVSCCAALSFFTSVMASVNVRGSFCRFLLLNCVCSLVL